MKRSGSRMSVLRKIEKPQLGYKPRKSIPKDKKGKKKALRNKKTKTMNSTPLDSFKASRNPSMNKIPDSDILKTIEKLHTPVLRASSFFKKLRINTKTTSNIHEDSTKETDRLINTNESRIYPQFYRSDKKSKKYTLDLRIPGEDLSI